MNAELYYLVGKPNSLKQALVSELRKAMSEHANVLVPQIYTTDEKEAKSENYIYIDERNFLLRESMDVYSLAWEKNGQHYGVSGDLSQRLYSGVDVILNGSFRNVNQAKKHFSNINTILIKTQGLSTANDDGFYLIAEEDEVRLEWDSRDAKFGQPYVLTVMSDESLQAAAEILSTFVTHNKNTLQYVV